MGKGITKVFLEFEQLNNGTWSPCEFAKLQAGDIFRYAEEPEAAFRALDVPYSVYDKDGIDRGNQGIKIKRISAKALENLVRPVALVKNPWWRRLYQWSIA